ncbi:MAG: flagellar hook-associated protein FlgK, partial [Alphaproteobacteria bacterium]|nr:flagellar hook-associated protein FlgK [Alphaproteobacteria bacterium]
NAATTTSSYYSTQNSYMSQVQAILDSTSNPPALSDDLSAFQAAWTEFAASPSDETIEKTVISAGQKFANTINNIAEQTATLKSSAEDGFLTSIAELNAALKRVEELNYEITTARANNQSSIDLEDQRDTAINEIAKYTNVTVMQRENGQVALYTQGGTVLLDGSARTFSAGSDNNTLLNNVGSDVTSALSGGILQAQTDFLSSTASSANGIGVITKIQSQLQNFANLFIATTDDGNSFADIYDNADTETGEQATQFFTVDLDSNGLPNLTTLTVNENLTSGETGVKTAAASDINDVFTALNCAITTTYNEGTGTYTYTTGTTFTASGLTTQQQTFAGIATSILSSFQQAANAIKTQSTSASTQESYYRSALSSKTGVNTDSELVALTNWENSYAASAHVISTIQSMMKTLEELVS